MIIKLTPKQIEKTRALAAIANRLGAQACALSAAAREALDFRMHLQARWHAGGGARYETVRTWLEPLNDDAKKAYQQSPAGQEWAQLEREYAEHVSGINRAAREAARLHEEAARLHGIAGGYREIVQGVGSRCGRNAVDFS